MKELGSQPMIDSDDMLQGFLPLAIREAMP